MNAQPETADNPHYAAYVGPSDQYDFMGATQFRLLTTLGMRAEHRLLDIGCGSLRAGRLFIPYLNAGRYFGIEPNKWLVDAAFENEIGRDILEIKKPEFAYVDDFSVPFDGKFDFVLAQSIFSHTELGLLEKALHNIAPALAQDGLFACTFLEASRDHPGEEWIYPLNVTYRPETIQAAARNARLSAVRIPWYHPRQDWYVMAHDASRLPTFGARRYLYGAVLDDPDLAESCSITARAKRRTLSWLARRFPESVKSPIKRLLR